MGRAAQRKPGRPRAARPRSAPMVRTTSAINHSSRSICRVPSPETLIAARTAVLPVCAKASFLDLRAPQDCAHFVHIASGGDIWPAKNSRTNPALAQTQTISSWLKYLCQRHRDARHARRKYGCGAPAPPFFQVRERAACSSSRSISAPVTVGARSVN